MKEAKEDACVVRGLLPHAGCDGCELSAKLVGATETQADGSRCETWVCESWEAPNNDGEYYLVKDESGYRTLDAEYLAGVYAGLFKDRSSAELRNMMAELSGQGRCIEADALYLVWSRRPEGT